MSNPPKEAAVVEIELASATHAISQDGNASGESKKKHGDHVTRSTAKVLEDIINAHHKRKRMWNTFFLLACCVAVFVDPLLCYINVIHEDTTKHITEDESLMLAYLCLRPIVDVIYIFDIIISVMRIIRKKRKDIMAKPFEACCCCLRSGDQRTVVRIHKLLPLLPRTLVALPILEIITILKLLPKQDWSLMYTFYIIIPIQYTLRIYDIYASLRRRPIMKTGILPKWLKPILDFLPFILASHLFGALWYRLAIQRQLDCWKLNCKTFIRELRSSTTYFDCEMPDTSLSEKFCPIREENSTTFNFGIYLYALQSNQKGTTPFIERLSQSFWWALRNLSSFGSNLNTSTLTSEIYFSVLISISGMALFLVYLNARVQEARESLKELTVKKKKQLMIPDVDLWLFKNVPKDLDKSVKKNLKTVIMDNIHKLEKHKVIDGQNILSVLPFHDKKQIVYNLCMASLRQVPLLETINEKVLRGIAEHLKPISYNDDNYIVQEGKPIGKMLFITQGIAWSYTTNGAKTECDSKWLERGSFCGEEVLHWACKSPFRSDLPISTRTITSQEKVEAFSIRASDLKSVISKFWWYFSKNVTSVSQLEQWEQFATSSILAARRHRQAKATSLRSSPTRALRRALMCNMCLLPRYGRQQHNFDGQME